MFRFCDKRFDFIKVQKIGYKVYCFMFWCRDPIRNYFQFWPILISKAHSKCVVFILLESVSSGSIFKT